MPRRKTFLILLLSGYLELGVDGVNQGRGKRRRCECVRGREKQTDRGMKEQGGRVQRRKRRKRTEKVKKEKAREGRGQKGK